MSNVTDSLKY